MRLFNLLFLLLIVNVTPGLARQSKSKPDKDDTPTVITTSTCTVGSICDKACCEGSYFAYDLRCKRFFTVRNGIATRITNLRDFRIRYNREVRFRILNVNRYLYNVTLAANDVEFGNEPPKLFKQLFLGESADSVISALTQNSDKAVSDNRKVKTFLDLFSAFKNKYDTLINTQLKAFSYCIPTAGCNCGTLSFSEMSSLLTDLRQGYVEAQGDLQDLKTGKNQKLEKCKKDEKNNEARVALQAELTKLETAKPRNQKQIDAKNAEIKALPSCPATTKKEIEDGLENIAATTKQLESIFDIVKAVSDKDLFKLVLFNNNFVNDHFNYMAPPIFPQGNRLELRFKISPTDTATKLSIMPLEDDSINLDLPVLRKPYVTFSSGIFFAGGNKLASDNYAFRAVAEDGVVTDTAQYMLVNQGTKRSAMGFAAMANIGARFRRSLGAGVSVGVGITIEERPRPAYLTGITGYWGDRKQFYVTVGCIALPVRRLKSALYQDDVTYTTKPDVEYDKKLRAGFFFALTYAVLEPERTENSKSGRK